MPSERIQSEKSSSPEGIGKLIREFQVWPVRNDTPLGFESQRLEFLTGPLFWLQIIIGVEGLT
jgi:hypothetical protein